MYKQGNLHDYKVCITLSMSYFKSVQLEVLRQQIGEALCVPFVEWKLIFLQLEVNETGEVKC